MRESTHIPLPRILVVDDQIGNPRKKLQDPFMADLNLVEPRPHQRPRALQDFGTGSVPLGEVEFHSGQQDDGHRVSNDIEGTMNWIAQRMDDRSEGRPALIVLDLQFDEGAWDGPTLVPTDSEPDEPFGLTLLRAMADRWPDVERPGRTVLPVVIFSAIPRSNIEHELHRLGVRGFFQRKPDHVERHNTHAPAFAACLMRHGLISGGLTLRQDTSQWEKMRHGLFGTSLRFLSCLRDARRAVLCADASLRTESGDSRIPTILLLGESGTGKTSFARYVAEIAGRHNRFGLIDAAAIPDSLMESEAFGHVKGAFTGATDKRTGIFEQFSGGVVFLDEIGEMSRTTLNKLLTAVRERQIRPVGDNEMRPVKNVLFISATNHQLEAEVSRGDFPADLFYRIGQHIIRLPALRDRAEDILPLFKEFVHRENTAAKGVAKRFENEGELESALLARPWPGNVDELARVASRIAGIEKPELTFIGASDLRTDDGHSPSPDANGGHQRVAVWNGSRPAERNGDLTERRDLLQIVEQIERAEIEDSPYALAELGPRLLRSFGTLLARILGAEIERGGPTKAMRDLFRSIYEVPTTNYAYTRLRDLQILFKWEASQLPAALNSALDKAGSKVKRKI